MTSNPHAATVALLLADSRLPSGGHVSSSGLEPALMGGLSIDQVPTFLSVRVRTVATVDAATAVVTRSIVSQLQSVDDAASVLALDEVERAWAARTPSRVQRNIAADLGRGLLRLAESLWPHHELLVDKTRPRPLVLGIIAAYTGMDAASLVRLVVYDDIASAVAAFLKLEPGDPAAATAMVLDACASAESETCALARMTTPDQIPAVGAPQLEQWVERHALTPRRLFRA